MPAIVHMLSISSTFIYPWNNHLAMLVWGNLAYQGPRCLRKHPKHPCCWSGGIIPPPFDVSIASNMVTTSSISGRLSGFASQQTFITFARELGQHRGISGLKFCNFVQSLIFSPATTSAIIFKEVHTCRTTADVISEKLRSGYGMSQQYISHRQMPKL